VSAPSLKYLTTCKLCNQRFSSSALPIIGAAPGAQEGLYLMKLGEHMRTAHRQHVQRMLTEAAAAQQMLLEWFTFKDWESQDPNLERSRDMRRSAIHNLTRKNRLNDADLIDKIARLELSEAEALKVTEMCKEIRDYLTEQGKYGDVQRTVLVS